MIELHEREDELPIEIVATGAILLPSLPFFAVARPSLKRLLYPVPTGEMNLIVSRVRNRPDIFQIDRHGVWFPLVVGNGNPRAGHAVGRKRLRSCASLSILILALIRSAIVLLIAVAVFRLCGERVPETPLR